MYRLIQVFVYFLCVIEVYCLTQDNRTSSDEIILPLQPDTNLTLSSIKVDSISQQGITDKKLILSEKLETLSNTIEDNPRDRMKKRRRRRRRKYKTKKHILVQGETTNSSLVEETTVAAQKKKRRRNRKKKKQNRNNTLETTTISVMRSNTFDSNENLMANLSNHKNETDEKEDFKNIRLNADEIQEELKKFFQNNYTSIHDYSGLKLGENFVISDDHPKRVKKRNRCSINNGGCSQICRLRGKVKCSCLKGYTLAKNRKKCVDIDECRVKNGGCREICKNTQGAFYCDCPAGLRLSENLRSCQDINECHLRNGHGPCQDTCTNTYGSYICDCSHLNGTRLSTDNHSCEDIDECNEASPGCSHQCINTQVGAFCSCPEGMELMSDYKTCQDVDECEDVTVKASCTRGCVNTVGSYYCEEDFQNDESLQKRKIPVCPPLFPPQYGFITCLRNNSSPYDTYDKNGRKMIKNSPGTKCYLECPVGFKLVGEGRYICGISGQWITKKQGFCKKALYPKLECPPDQELSLEQGQESVVVTFPPPRTNTRWKIVKSYPRWAKGLKGELREGRHNVQFSVTDPSSKLSSSCSFTIVIKK